MNNVIPFPKKWQGDRWHRHFIAKVKVSKRKSKECDCCGGMVRRSWKTGILHDDCRACRYLKLMYGPNIKVTLEEL